MKWGDAVKVLSQPDLMTVYRVDEDGWVWTYWWDSVGDMRTRAWEPGTKFYVVMGGKWEKLE